MKRALTFWVAAVCFCAVSFVQAANVELSFYSGTPCANLAPVDELHYAIVSVDGNTLVKGDLTVEDRGTVVVDIEPVNFYVVAEQASTKFFGGVLIDQKVAADELFFVLDESGLTWLKDAHRCYDEECKINRDDSTKSCLDDEDVCDEDCVCRKLQRYCLGKDGGSYGQTAQGSVAKTTDAATRGTSGTHTPTSLASRASNVTSPYASGVSNFANPYSVNGFSSSPFGMFGAGARGGWGLAAVGVALGVALPVALSGKSSAGTAKERR